MRRSDDVKAHDTSGDDFDGCVFRIARMNSQPRSGVRPSAEVKNTVLGFYQKMRASDMSGFDEFVSTDPALLVIGSSNEWYTERERLRGVFRLGNQGLEAGSDPIAYENGDMGWFIDRPDWIFSDGSRMHTRFTAIVHREAGAWKLVHWHLSVGVPDDEVVALQRRWLNATLKK